MHQSLSEPVQQSLVNVLHKLEQLLSLEILSPIVLNKLLEYLLVLESIPRALLFATTEVVLVSIRIHVCVVLDSQEQNVILANLDGPWSVENA
jgi:hypothetical protein